MPFEIREGLLFHQPLTEPVRLCVPHKCVKEILEQAHDNTHHHGVKRMVKNLANVSITALTRRVKEYVEHCQTCLENANIRQKMVGELSPHEITPIPGHTIAIDFIVGLPNEMRSSMWKVPEDGFDACMSVSGQYNKKTIAIPRSTTWNVQEWGRRFITFLQLCDWGLPSRIISDRDPKFINELWKGMFAALNTKLLMTTAYHAERDGLSERKNQEIELAIRYHIATDDEDIPWPDILPAFQ